MKCIFCGYEDSKVVDSRLNDSNSIRRRRECLNCGKRYTTYETIETFPILVVKENGTIEPFDKQKIKKGIIKACEKRPISLKQIDEIANNIERQIQNKMLMEIKSNEIGEFVMEELKKLDKVAYVRFASVYRQFEDITSFKNLLSEL